MCVIDACCRGKGREETKAATPAMSMPLHSSIFGLWKIDFRGCFGTNILVVPSSISENICYWTIRILFIYLHPIESEGQKISEKIQLKDGISKIKFGYYSKMGGYTTLMSGIQELDYIFGSKRRGENV